MSHLHEKFRLPFFIALFVLFTQATCDSSHQNIPYVPVNFDINLNLPAYNTLNFPSEYILLAGGSQGLIIYRYTMDEFVVLDRHSTFDIPLNCKVTVDSDGVTLIDAAECSESKWLVLDGSVMQGPAMLPLHRYRSSWNPPILHVYN